MNLPVNLKWKEKFRIQHLINVQFILQIIKMPDKEYESYLLHYDAYTAKALKLLIPEYKKQLKRIPFDNLTFNSSPVLIAANFDQESLREVLFKIHYTIGMAYGLYNAKLLRKENPIQEKKWKPLPFLMRHSKIS